LIVENYVDRKTEARQRVFFRVVLPGKSTQPFSPGTGLYRQKAQNWQQIIFYPGFTNVFYSLMITWQQPDRPVVLASQSPRRKQILAQMGFAFNTVHPGMIDEASFIKPPDLEQSLQKLAAAKAATVADRYPGSLVLGADTIVVKNMKVLGKPSDAGDAAGMLSLLSGSKHTVMTGIALVCREQSFLTTAVDGTDVFFRTITEHEIDDYLKNDEYRDKAGAYAIQGKALVFINGINGCYYNVVGLPVAKTIFLFKKYAASIGIADGR
jgi:septum formation protein